MYLKGTLASGEVWRMEIDTQAKSLSVDNEPLIELDLSPLAECYGLEELHIYDTKLTAIDLSPLTTCTSLSVLDMHGNNFESLDLTPLVGHPFLEVLVLHRNNLTSVDFTSLSNCHRLRFIALTDNPLSNVDVSPLEMGKLGAEFHLKTNKEISIQCDAPMTISDNPKSLTDILVQFPSHLERSLEPFDPFAIIRMMLSKFKRISGKKLTTLFSTYETTFAFWLLENASQFQIIYTKDGGAIFPENLSDGSSESIKLIDEIIQNFEDYLK